MARDEADKKPNIVNGRLERCSPSQVKTWKLCQGKWAQGKIDNLPRKPDGKGVILGKEGHGQIETWAETGQDIRSDLARLSDPYLKPFYRQLPFVVRKAVEEWTRPLHLQHGEDQNGKPVVAINVTAYEAAIKADVTPRAAIIEQPLPKLFTPGGVEMVGYADMIFRPGHDLMITAFEPSNVKHAIPDGGFFDARHLPCVVDHKFRSNVDKYAETATELEMDEQAIIYGRACLELWPDAPQIVFRHHNHQTKGRRFASAVTCVLGSDHIRLQWKAICDLIDGPMQTAAKAGTLSVVFNEGACGAFGGCDFEATCSHSPSNRLMASIRSAVTPQVKLEGSKPMGSLSDRLKAVTGGAPADGASQAQTSTAPAQSSTPAVSTPATTQQVASTPTQAAADFAKASQCVPGNLYMVIIAEGGGVMKCEGVLPTGAFFSGPTGTPKLVPLTTDVRDVSSDPVSRANFKLPPLANTNPVGLPIVENGVQVHGTPIAGIPQAGVTPPDMPQHAAAAPNVVSTPPATQTTPTPAATGTTPAPAQTDAPTAAGKKKRGKGKKGENTIDLDESLILLVNSSSTEARDLSPFVLDLAQKVAAKHGLADVRLAPQEHALAFGRWKAIIAGAALAECPTGICAIRSGELSDPVIEALSGVADFVVR